MARVPVPRSSPVPVPPPDMAEVREAADADDLLAIARILSRPAPKNGRLTEAELQRRFARMLNQVYEYAREHDSPIRQVVVDYREYLTRLSRQDIDVG